jgi:hypothetical protein
VKNYVDYLRLVTQDWNMDLTNIVLSSALVGLLAFNLLVTRKANRLLSNADGPLNEAKELLIEYYGLNKKLKADALIDKKTIIELADELNQYKKRNSVEVDIGGMKVSVVK